MTPPPPHSWLGARQPGRQQKKKQRNKTHWRHKVPEGISLLPAPRVGGDVEPRLVKLADTRMLAPARAKGYELPVIGVTALPQRQQVVARSRHGEAWLFADHAEDPTAMAHRGRVPIPAGQYARLRDLDAAGVRPGVVWLAHQLPDGWEEGDPVPVPAPKQLRERDSRLARGLARASGMVLRAGGLAARGAAALPAIGAAVGAGLDPVVLGGVVDGQAQAALWVVLAQWDWE